MHPIDFRNATYETLRARLTGLREKVWVAWIAHGPATTRECARLSGIDLLTFRPRTTELYQLGGVCLAEEEPPSHSSHSSHATSDQSEGRYRARTDPEWRAWLQAQRAALDPALQLQLPIPVEPKAA